MDIATTTTLISESYTVLYFAGVFLFWFTFFAVIYLFKRN